MGGALVAREGFALLEQHPQLASIFFVAVTLVVAHGGLVSFWILTYQLKFRRRGYQIVWLAGNEWAYEERRTDGSIEFVPFFRKFVGEGYPTPCEVHIPSEDRWDRQVPEWAQGRRREILGRIAEQCGADRGGRIQFVDATRLLAD